MFLMNTAVSSFCLIREPDCLDSHPSETIKLAQAQIWAKSFCHTGVGPISSRTFEKESLVLKRTENRQRSGTQGFMDLRRVWISC